MKNPFSHKQAIPLNDPHQITAENAYLYSPSAKQREGIGESIRSFWSQRTRPQQVLVVSGTVLVLFSTLMISLSFGHSSSTKTSQTMIAGSKQPSSTAQSTSSASSTDEATDENESTTDSAATSPSDVDVSWWQSLLNTIRSNSSSTTDDENATIEDEGYSSSASDNKNDTNNSETEDEDDATTELTDLPEDDTSAVNIDPGTITSVSYTTFISSLDCGLMEGGTSDGRYLYSACITDKNNVGDHKIVKVLKIDLATKRIIKTANFYRESIAGNNRSGIGHANDMAYNTRSGKLIIAAWDGGKSNKILIVNPDTLVVESRKALDSKGGNSSSLCYDSAANQYLAQGIVYDNNFKYVKKIYTEKQVLKDLGMARSSISPVDQGIECIGSRIYVMWLSRTQYYARIAAYDWSGKLMAKYQFNIGAEVENIAISGNAMYIGVNNGSFSKTYAKKNKLKVPLFKKDYYIKLNGVMP